MCSRIEIVVRFLQSGSKKRFGNRELTPANNLLAFPNAVYLVNLVLLALRFLALIFKSSKIAKVVQVLLKGEVLSVFIQGRYLSVIPAV